MATSGVQRARQARTSSVIAIALSLTSAFAAPAGSAMAAGVPGAAARAVSAPPLLRDCAALAGHHIDASEIALPTRGATIVSATRIPAQPKRIDDTAVRHATPGYCAVQGEIAPVDTTAPPIRFQVNIPTHWNRKALQVGGGGLNGRIPASLAQIGASGSPISGAFPPDAPYPISQGYASYGGDSGHSETGLEATWALNDEAWTNFGHAGLKKTRDAAYAVFRVLYGHTPDVNYFMGQSQGGREALEVAQRYPEDYDGVVATAPLIGYVPHVLHKAVLAGAQPGPGWIPPARQAAIAAYVLQACDRLDGLADGIISHYAACTARLDPEQHPDAFAALSCKPGADTQPDCLSDAQIRTLQRMHAPLSFNYPLANGWTTFPGYGTGREDQASWLSLASRPDPAVSPPLGQPGATILYGILKDPGANLLSLSLDDARERIQAASALIDSTNPDLSRFFARGGRLIVKVGSADYNANPRTMMRYYDAVVARHGQALVDEHVRLYVQPGGNHSGEGVLGSGEPIPQYVDLITLMTDWVERKITPPDAPTITAASRLPPHAVTAARPLCRYPQYPHYDGHGDPRQAASFACRH